MRTQSLNLSYLRIPKEDPDEKKELSNSRTSPGLIRSQGCRYGRIRTRFAPARRAARTSTLAALMLIRDSNDYSVRPFRCRTTRPSFESRWQ